jgi:CubicO group peptidase (beta-lactamase class C family)
MKKNFLLLVSLIFLHNLLPAQDSIPYFVKDSMDVYIEKALNECQIPGIAVCIVKNGKVVVMNGYGVKESGKQDKVDEHTLFMIGSNTKAFTATALAILETEKKLSLNDRVTKWIPYFKLNNKLAGEQAIIRDLLCHRMGFETFQGDFTYWTSNLSRKEVIETMGRIKAPYDFRTKWGYCNAAFATAGEIIPAASGKQWDEYLKEKIFTPLEMTRTLALSKEITNATNAAKAHTVENGQLHTIPYGVIDNLAAAGSIASSVNDMSHWVMMQLNSGKYNDKQVVPANAIAQTWLPHSVLGNGGHMYNKGHFALYGLGWFLEEYSGRKIVSHTGGVNGFVTSVTLVPEEKLGVIVLTNTDQNSFYEALKWEIVDAYLGNQYRNYNKVYLGYSSAQQKQEEIKEKKYADSVALKLTTALPFAAYTGNYSNEVYGDMKVVLENNELRMRFSHHPNMYAKLETLGGNRFYASFSDPAFGKAIFPFTVADSKVKSVTIKVADFVEYNAYEFIKKLK